jgi:hypothetical protein
MAIESLYKQYAHPAPPRGAGPGTYETKSIETVDNDHSVELLSIGLGSIPLPPGTRLTASIETIDNDVAGIDSMLFHTEGPRPPGTAITATIETMDNDTGILHSLNAGSTQ